jgi:hypothetical protein
MLTDTPLISSNVSVKTAIFGSEGPIERKCRRSRS